MNLRYQQELIELVHIKISAKLNNYNIVSFVGFSMGGLVIRAYLNRYKTLNLGKVIMIGTPNNGSEVADFFKGNNLYKKCFGPAGEQLVTNPKNLDNLYGKLYYECGIIAGNLPLDFYYFLFKGKSNDGKVTVDSTKLDNIKDHIVIKVSHWYLPIYLIVIFYYNIYQPLAFVSRQIILFYPETLLNQGIRL